MVLHVVICLRFLFISVGRTSYHVVASTKEILLLDERFPKQAVLRYPCQATTSPLYLRALSDVIGSNGMILAGSQMSQQVFCLETALGTSGLTRISPK